eukprot:CAMPEP_0184522942 /NCGR_PEP_ID=MMETSP0198_2-20121128/8584_1 /TAXON_ID=1112570 /ORGANISM="Thraustochytrium sp., Strain LLF1b" /LENGTH=65 /DNA_ID=CAMNT_0026913869 /DNA_START=23 /DNA_END=217 /DNA_ORIENTATION=-
MSPLPMAAWVFPLDPCARSTLHVSGWASAKRRQRARLLNGLELRLGPQVKGQRGAPHRGPLSRRA